MADQEHDHSGDRLGEEAPVESIDVEEVTIRDFAIPNSYVVYEDGGSWHAFRTRDQDVEFTDVDGATVINRALERLAERGEGARANGSVLVTADAGGGVIESDTSIVHTADGAALVLEPGITFRYTGAEEAVVLAGDGISLEFARIEAPEARHGIVDLGIRNATVEGQTLTGGGKALWLSDAENRIVTGPGPSGSHVRILQMDCGGKADRGIALTSAPGESVEGYKWEVAVIHPKRKGISIGDDSAADSVHDHEFYASVRGEGSKARSLVEINDSRNGIFLESHTTATGGDWDVVVRESVEDAFVMPLTGRDTIRVKREAQVAADFSKVDPFRHEVMELDFAPDSLDGYGVVSEGTGETSLTDGVVVQDTGTEAGSWANVRKRMHYNFGRLLFDNAATLRTQVELSANDDQRAWMLWGDRQGHAVGWAVVDDRLEGYVHDGRGDTQSATRTTLVDGFAAGSSWTLTAFYNPPTGVHYYVDDRLAGTIEKNIPSGTTAAHRVLTMDLTNTGAGSKRLRWGEWKNHQYPGVASTDDE